MQEWEFRNTRSSKFWPYDGNSSFISTQKRAVIYEVKVFIQVRWGRERGRENFRQTSTWRPIKTDLAPPTPHRDNELHSNTYKRYTGCSISIPGVDTAELGAEPPEKRLELLEPAKDSGFECELDGVRDSAYRDS